MTTSSVRSAGRRGRRRAGRRRRARPSTSTHPLGRAVAGVHDDDAVAVARASRRCRRTPARRRRGRRRRPAPAASAVGTAPAIVLGVGRRRSASSASPNGLTVHQALPCARACSRTSARARYDAAPRSIGAVPPPAAAAQLAPEELLAGRDQVVGAARARSGSSTSTWVSVGQQVDEQLHLVDEHRGQRLHALDGDAGGDLVGELEQLRVLAARARRRGSRTSSVSSSSRHGGAQSRSTCLERALVGDREACGSPRRRRPRTPPAAGAPRSAGTRRRCRRGPRTRRASRPGRPGSTPRPRAADDVLERRGVAGHQLDRLEVAEPLDLRLQHRADRRDDDLQRPVGGVGRPGWRSRRSTASRRPTVSLRGLSRSCGSVSQLG